MSGRSEIEQIILEHWVEKWDHPRYPTAVRCMKQGCDWQGRFPGDIAGHNADLISAALAGEEGTSEPLQPPVEHGMVRYRVEVMPHDWANDGLAWEVGTQPPADVARALRAVADQVGYFTAPVEGGAA